MVVNFEFLGNEPIENVITCMHHKIDKVVFFGYADTINKMRSRTETFLKDNCDVHDVDFKPLPQDDLQAVIRTMRKEILLEITAGNKVYFDITGGESLILVAFGMLSKEFDSPMHVYDVESDRLIELDDGSPNHISEDVEERVIPMTLDLMVKMFGGIINSNLHADYKSDDDADFSADVEKMFLIEKDYWSYWNPLCDFLRNNMGGSNLEVDEDLHTITGRLNSSNNELNSINLFNEIIYKLESAGVLLDVSRAGNRYRFRYKNSKVYNCLRYGGNVLEMHTYLNELSSGAECMVGVNLDWDGVIHQQVGIDVFNELDMLSLTGVIPTFMSCKSGKLAGPKALNALYELDTIAKRFGGKYAKRVLVTMVELGDVYKERAAEMGIQLVHYVNQ